MRIFLIFIFVLLPFCLNSQTKEESVADTTIYKVVEQMPMYKGGHSEMLKFVMENLKFPIVPVEEGIEGKIIFSFVVEKDGSLSNIKLKKPNNTEWEKEIIKLVKSMPEWIPGRQNGRAVRVEYTIPLNVHWQK